MGKKVKLNGKVVGKLVKTPGGLAYKTYRGEKHRMRKFDSFGITKELLDSLKRKGVEDVIIDYEDDRGIRKRYAVKLNKFLEEGIEWRDDTHFKDDKQLHLPIDKMKRIR